jgi:hypothetical protein
LAAYNEINKMIKITLEEAVGKESYSGAGDDVTLADSYQAKAQGPISMTYGAGIILNFDSEEEIL